MCSYRETPAARRALDDLAASHSMFQSIYDSLVWVVLRDTTVGTPIPLHEGVFVVRSLDFLAIGLPVILVVYRVLGGNLIEIVDIILSP